jgi:hypothetical protein
VTHEQRDLAFQGFEADRNTLRNDKGCPDRAVTLESDGLRQHC